MFVKRPYRGAAAVSILAASGMLCSTRAPVAGQHDTAARAGRPALRVRAPTHQCPEIEGAYVALLDRSRGILLLSSDEFPGGSPVGTANGTPMRVSGGAGTPWQLAEVGGKGASNRVWATRYGFRDEPLDGCVAFDKNRFSAEGDLASYVYWLVGSVYSKLPVAERRRDPAFRLSDRQVRVRISRPGQGEVDLAGKEGATLACRFADSGRVYLVIPFVLDQSTERVAVQVGFTDRPYWEAAEKTTVAFVVALPGMPVQVADLGLEIAVLDVAPAPGG